MRMNMEILMNTDRVVQMHMGRSIFAREHASKVCVWKIDTYDYGNSHMAWEVNVYDYGSINAYEYRFIPPQFTASVTVISDLVLYVQKEKNNNFKIAQKALARPHQSFVQTKKCMYSANESNYLTNNIIAFFGILFDRCKTSTGGQSAGLSITRSSVQVWHTPIKNKTENSNLHGCELHRPSSKSDKLLFQVIKAIIH